MPKSSGFYNEQSFSVDNTFTEISLLHKSENGYSEVYKALRHGKWHILKCLTQEERHNPRFQHLLQKEFEISYPLSHPGIVHTIGMEEVPDLGICIIQEYIDGKPLEAVTIDTIRELCLAIDYIHQRGIVHRDIKPDNILITRDGHHPVLIDLGLADRANFAYLKEPAGTTGYASPEQQKPGLIDNRSDIYSLGVLIDDMVSGGFNGFQEVYPSTSSGTSFRRYSLHRIAKKCLANNPEKRFVSAMEIYHMLEPVKWWRLLLTAVFVIVSVMAVMWYATNREQQSVITGLQQQTVQQRRQSQMQQQQIKAQQEHIASLKHSISSMSSNMDSMHTVNATFSKRIAEEDQQAVNLRLAKKDIRTIALKEYKRIWDSHPELADQPKKRRLTTQYEIYAIDWHPIVANLIKKYRLNPNTTTDINKVLMDEWMFALYNIVKNEK